MTIYKKRNNTKGALFFLIKAKDNYISLIGLYHEKGKLMYEVKEYAIVKLDWINRQNE